MAWGRRNLGTSAFLGKKTNHENTSVSYSGTKLSLFSVLRPARGQDRAARLLPRIIRWAVSEAPCRPSPQGRRLCLACTREPWLCGWRVPWSRCVDRRPYLGPGLCPGLFGNLGPSGAWRMWGGRARNQQGRDATGQTGLGSIVSTAALLV